MSTSKYSLRLSCGPSKTAQNPLTPNKSEPTTLDPPPSGLEEIQLRVFVENFRGYPEGAPASHPYFSHPSRKGELYSLRIDFVPSEPIPGDDLVLGNDFDRPIRDSLPFWFSGAWKALKWVDPGVDGDVYADQPGVWGRVLGSVNVLQVVDPSSSPPSSSSSSIFDRSSNNSDAGSHGNPEDELEQSGCVIFEDLSGCGVEGVPTDPAARRKFFLDEKRRKEFVFQAGRRYRLDFGNGFIDFNEFGLRLPGFKVNVLKYWDGQPLRYVLKNRRTEQVYAAVVFELVVEA